MRSAAVFLMLCSIGSATIVDRLAITVGPVVITELQIDEDIRVAALLSGQPVKRNLDARRAAADRLIEQLLIQHEIQISRYPAPSEEEVQTLYAKIRETLGGPDKMRQLLSQYDVSEDTLLAHLMNQLATLRFIEFRFRPDISISDSEIEAAYRRRQAESSTHNLPPLDAKERSELVQFLTEERTDAALDSWLAESRKQVNIAYLDATLQ